MVYTQDIERFAERKGKRESPSLTTEEFEKKLRSFGLEDYEVELIMAKFVDDMTFQDLVQNQNWTSSGSATYHFRQVLKKLRERGYK